MLWDIHFICVIWIRFIGNTSDNENVRPRIDYLPLLCFLRCTTESMYLHLSNSLIIKPCIDLHSIGWNEGPWALTTPYRHLDISRVKKTFTAVIDTVKGRLLFEPYYVLSIFYPYYLASSVCPAHLDVVLCSIPFVFNIKVLYSFWKRPLVDQWKSHPWRTSGLESWSSG